MSSSLSRKIALSMAIALAAGILVTGGVGFQRKVATFQSAGLVLQEGAQGQVRVASVDPELHPELRRGDRLLLIDGDTVQDAAGALRALRATPDSELVVMRGDEALTLGYERGRLAIDYSYLVLAVIGAVYLLIGLYTILREQSRQAIVFYLWCLASSATFILASTPAEQLTIDSTGQALYVLEEAARVLLPALTLHFFVTFPRDLAGAAWSRRLVPLLYVPSVFLLVLQSDLIFNQGRWLLGAPRGTELAAVVSRLDRLELFLLATFSIAAGGLLLYRLTFGERREARRQLAWIALGMACGYVPFLALYLIPFSLGLVSPPAVEVAAVLPLAIVPLTFAYALLRYRLWDISVIARDVATYTLTLLFGLLGFSFLHLLVQRGIPESQGLTRDLLSVAAVVLIGGLLVPARQGISSTLERVQYRHSFGKRRTLGRLGRELLHDRDLERLSRKLLEHLEEALALETTNLMLLDGDGRLTPHRDVPGNAAFSPGRLLGDGFWDEDWREIPAGALPDASQAPTHDLYALGYRYVFPLSVRGRRVGVLLCGYRYGELPLSSQDLELIRQLLNQVSLALENAQLLDRLQGQLEEVRELKQYNEGIIEASPAGIAVLDGEGKIISANLAFAALAGKDRSTLRRKSLVEIFPLQHVPRAEDGLRELRLHDLQGRERILQLSVASFVGSRARELSVLVVNDITERVAMERALKENERLAALGVMAAGIAHEVNTPITGISSYAQMLLECTGEQDPRYPLLKKVERQTFRASRIVNSLLSLARNEDGEPQPLDLGKVVDDSLELLQQRIEKWRIRVEVRGRDEELVVRGFDGQLHQVFTNLFQNAIEAMKEEGGTLRVDFDAVDSWIEVGVEDTGPGIPAAMRQRIFEPFYTTKQEAGGTGLGLSISHEIVRRHGGELRLEEMEPSTGCRFVVRLPATARRQA